MERTARAFPIKSREAVEAMCQELDRRFTSEDKKILAEEFELDCELQYYQEIEGKPYVITVIQGETLEKGFKDWAKTTNPFASWFREQVLAISGHELSKNPKGPKSDLVYELRAQQENPQCQFSHFTKTVQCEN